jgi:iron complex outermembrane recepter protein
MAQLFEILQSRRWRSRVATGVLAATGLVSGAAIAADAAAELEEVVVTGSRIANPNALSSSPILGVTAQDLRSTGIVDIGNLVDQLPQHIRTNNDLSNTNNPLTGPGGITTLNLRGLGPSRTLVLVDGKRLGVGDPNSGNPTPSADINQIPAALVQRVDVVTGGASAVYGSDAIAGVANFIMRRDIEGVEVDAQYGFNWHNNDNGYMQNLLDTSGITHPNEVVDGNELAVTLMLGGGFADDRGHATAYLSYLDADPTTLSERDFSACQLAGGGTRCGGSVNSNWFESTLTGDVFAVSGDQLVEWGTVDTTPPAVFNSNPYMNLKHGRERYQGGVFADYVFSDKVTLYTNFMFTQDKANTAVAPSGLFTSAVVDVYCNNPLFTPGVEGAPSQQALALGCTEEMIADGDTVGVRFGRRNIEGGPRQFGYEHTSYFAVGGLKGDINDAWSYDAYGSYYYVDSFNTNKNYVSKLRGALGLNGCQSNASGDIDASCVPYNIWQDGGVTPEAAQYVSTYGLADGSAGQEVLSASMTGDLGAYGLQLPSAKDAIRVAFGAEYRTDSYSYLPDLNLGSGDLSGGGGASPTIDAETYVMEYFAELRVPLVQDMTGVQDLVFEGGYRYSDYELAGGVDTYKLGLQWAPVDDIRFRGSFNHAIRAPSLIELYVGQTVTQTSTFSSDPCSGENPTASLEDCERTGVTPAQYTNISNCPSSQCSVLTGGNPDLLPEEADTVTVGFTLNPSFLPGFTMSVDWYEIEIEGIVGNIPLPVIFEGCLDGTNLSYCNDIVRAPDGVLFGDSIDGGGYIVGTNANVSEATFSGVDIQGSYRFEVGSMGSMAASLNGTYVLETTTTPLPGDPSYDCAGLYGLTCGQALPDWRSNLRLDWMLPVNVTVGLQWRFLSSVEHEQNSSDPELQGDPVTFGGKLDSMNYFDLSASWAITEQYDLRFGINNILDEDPPLVDTGWSGPGTPNTWGPYDTLGRQVFLGVNAKF